MNWIPDAKVGDRFRWRGSDIICRITRIKDIAVYFDYEVGPRSGSWGYTSLPQDIELLTVLDDLAEI